MIPSEPACQLRAMRESDGLVRVVTRNLTISAEGQLSLDSKSNHPSALDLLVSALAVDVLTGLHREASRSGVALHDVELRLTARLDNPLVALGVVGETGSSALTDVTGSLYVSTDAGETEVRALWLRALDHAPVYATLQRTVRVRIDIRTFV